MIYYYCNQK